MSKEAMKLALDALQKIYIAPEHEEYIRVWWPACEEAITALREALAEQPAPMIRGDIRDGLVDDEPAQRPWVEVEQVKWEGSKLIAKLKEKNT